MPISLRITLCLVTSVLCNVHASVEHEIPRRSFLSRRAIDGTRGRKFFDPEEEGAFDSFGSAGGQYDPYEIKTDLADIRKNVPGEPGVDYPAYTTLPQTGFTCEGRSRGYYADEGAGCQVFHVCHDILVSSFLCPIGSLFSQKLLTCDWWTKVDCASSRKYIQVNRNSYQVDDDEMIRKAYAMISLQSGRDVTKDGLVDPDRGGRLVDFGTVDSANAVPNDFDDYPTAGVQFLSNYDYRGQKPTMKSFQDNVYFQDKPRSPYHDSPIIRIQKINEPRYPKPISSRNEFQEDYRKPEGFTNQFQPSYAPTVPTVTTTTRRLYSPTVPTTYRPSTLAYSKLDQAVESSNNYYARSEDGRSFVTPPTIIFPRSDRVGVEEGKSQRSAKRIEDYEAYEKYGRESGRENYGRFSGDFEDNFEGVEAKESIGLGQALSRHHERIGIRVQDVIKSERFKEEEKQVDLSTAEKSLNDTQGFDIIRNESDYSEIDKKVNGDDSSKQETLEYRQTLVKPDAISFERKEEESTVEYPREFATTPSYEAEEYLKNHAVETRASTSDRDSSTEGKPAGIHLAFSTTSTLDDRTTTERTETTIKPPTTSAITLDDFSNRESTRGEPDGIFGALDPKNSSVPSEEIIQEDPVSKRVLQPSEFLKPPEAPRETFRITVPEPSPQVTSLSDRYSTIDDSTLPEIGTTELPRFESAFSEGIQSSTNFEDYGHREEIRDSIGIGDSLSFIDYPTTEASLEFSSDWLSSSWKESSIIDLPSTAIVPPVSSYSEGFEEFLPRVSDSKPLVNHEERSVEGNPTVFLRNETETDILSQYNSGFKFTIRDAIPKQFDVREPCSILDGSCGTIPPEKVVVSSPPTLKHNFDNVESKDVINPSVKPEFHPTFGGAPSETSENSATPSTVTLQPDTLRSTTGSGVDVKNDFIESTLTTVTQRSLTESKNIGVESKAIESERLEERRVIDSSNLDGFLRSIRPDTLRQIEESIEKNNSPYQISLTVNKNDEVVSNTDDVISRLILQQSGKANGDPASIEKFENFEVLSSLEPNVPSTIDGFVSPSNISEAKSMEESQPRPKILRDAPSGFDVPARNESSRDSSDVNKKGVDSNANTVSLLQLMAELLKVDRYPRPFTLKDSIELRRNLQASSQSVPRAFTNLQPSRTVTRETNFDVRNNGRSQEALIGSDSNNPRPLLKEHLLEQLTENFGQPLYRANHQFELPEVQRRLDFETGLPIGLPINPGVESPINPAINSQINLPNDSPINSPHNSPIDLPIDAPITAPIHSQINPGNLEDGINFEPLRTKSPFLVAVTNPSVPSTTAVPATSKATTTEGKTVVETEFLPSIGFSFDTDQGREAYVEAVLGGLLSDRRVESGRNETAEPVDTGGTGFPDEFRERKAVPLSRV